MTILDAKRAFREMVVEMEPEHAQEVKAMIAEAEKAALALKAEPKPDAD